MSKIKIVMDKENYANVGQLLKGDDLKAILQEHSDRVVSRAKGNYNVKIIRQSTRIFAKVESADSATDKMNRENNDLLVALGGGL